MSSSSTIETSFSGISDPSDYPPHNGLAVGPNNVVMAEDSRIEWTNLSGGAATTQSLYQFFQPLGAMATNALFDPRCVYDSVNNRYIVTVDNIGSGGTVSNIDIAVSKDSNPNDGWYFASLNTSLTINSQLTSSDHPMVSVDGTNIYIAAPQYNVNVSGYAGTECWVIGDTAGPGGGIYNGGTLTVLANQITSPNQGIFTVLAGSNGKSYYACDYSTGSQIVVTLQTYDPATNTFGPTSTVALGNIDQGGSYTAQQQGTTLLLDVGDKRIQNLAYANGFLYGVCEEKPIGSSVPEVHWFKIDVSSPASPTLVAQGDISGAAIGTNVATFDASIAVDGAGDVIVNFVASGPNMYPSDYYVYEGATDPPNSFSAPILYQASTGYFNSGNGASTQRWGDYSSAIVDPNNPRTFWISNEYVANGWWQTSVAQVAIQTLGTTPPPAPTGLSLDATTDSGTKGDGITNFTQVKIDGTAQAGSTVTLCDTNGTTVLGTGPADATTGVFGITTSTLSDGTHSITAKATDAAGNTSAASTAYSVTVDTTPPAVTERLVNDTGSSSTDQITSNDALTGSGDANAVVHFTIDGTAIAGTATGDISGIWTFTPPGLADGQHTIVASETDAAGNTGTASLTFTLDTVAPTVTITSAGGITNQATQTISGTVTAAAGEAAVGATVTLYDNGSTTPIGTATVQSNGTWSTSVTLANGTNTLTAKDTDAAGNTGVSNAVTYTLSTMGPVVTESLVNDTGSSSTDKITSNDALTGTGNPNAVVHFTVDGTPIAGTATADSNGVWTFTPPGLADGQHTIVASETDAAGNTGTASLTFTLDQDTSEQSALSLNVADTLIGSAGAATVHFTIGGLEPDDGGTVTFGDGTHQVTVNVSGAQANYMANLTTLGDGPITSKLSLNNDAAGNTFIPVSGNTVILDQDTNEHSTVTLSGLTGGNPVQGTAVLATVTDEDLPSSGISYSWQVSHDGGTSWTTVGTNSNGYTPSETDEGGQLHVLTSFVDLAGNTETGSALAGTVMDAPPTLTVSGHSLSVNEGGAVGLPISVAAFDSDDAVSVNVAGLPLGATLTDGFDGQTFNGGAPITLTAAEVNGGLTLHAGEDGSATLTVTAANAEGAGATTAPQSISLTVNPVAETPTLTISNTSLTVAPGGSVAMGISVTPTDADDNVSVTISGLPKFETITAGDGNVVTKKNGSYTFTAADVNSGLTLHSSYQGKGNRVNTLTVTATNTTLGETATSPPGTITVTDPPATIANTSPDRAPLEQTMASGPDPARFNQFLALLDQLGAASFHNDRSGVGQMMASSPPQFSLEDLSLLTRPHHGAFCHCVLASS